MLKVRIVPTLLASAASLVKGVGFDSARRIGTAAQAVRVFNLRDVDELVYLDVGATPWNHPPDFALIDEIADDCSMPLTIGGGVRSIDDIEKLLSVGADKVAINSAALEAPELISDGAQRFGVQCIVVSIDYRTGPDGRPKVVGKCGRSLTERDPVAWAKEAADRGAGEIILCSVERDGTMRGYDIPTLRAVNDVVRIPVIASGGAGSYDDFVAAVRDGGAAAVAAGAMFQFTEMTPRDAREYMRAAGIPVRG